jgi:hypothetical protein
MTTLQIAYICQRVAFTLRSFARGYGLPSRAAGRGFWITSRDICKGLPNNKERGTSSEKQKVKIKTQEAKFGNFNNYHKFVF